MRLFVRLGLFVCLFLPLLACAASTPRLALVDVYPGNLDLSHYWVSEKYDGVRGYWDGQAFWTRQGTAIHAPDWFTERFPDTALDGELWIDHDSFSRVSSIVRMANQQDENWHAVTYLIFDLPDHPGTFDERVPAIRQTVATMDVPWVRAIEQFRVPNEAALKATLKQIVDKGGEGLVLHDGATYYRAGRGVGMYKLKPHDDAEARVIDYVEGKGRLEGMMGSLVVETPTGQIFRLGTGFTDEERRHPPAVGDWVTYRYNGKTRHGLPRFARFLRVRPEGPPPE